ncbi:hypothetical protein BJI67_05020 [Acidihalobacter aeolianus]|uniref:YgjP-like metallopeptidase domain-containing protein n=1 Tax=Acidihalobacter aeolianus TaxID=2792603 RepID=A0A1D8K6B9_9GAMM|nr:SprT family zinc-dependent metalloprotease [Acidihalobacter aeolianus]AOV16517.1 hypothetical protein BJI67_05020 [Acidihalobacter aeolianus]
MPPTLTLPWLEHCELRYSARARRLRITVSSHSGVVVTLPHGLGRAHALDFVERQRTWIEHQLARLPVPAAGPPERVTLPILDLELTVRQAPETRGTPFLQETDGMLQLGGDWRTNTAWCDLFAAWLRRRAKPVLQTALSAEAARMGLRHGRLSVRLQRTRWGSCNRHGDISLNAKLLLLPQPLVRHVLIHELAHIRHLNHSPAFWTVVADADPEWHSHRRTLREASALMPAWLDARPGSGNST